ncbi:FAD/NAD(P)-binding domain-containing protein [Aureobasidium subglaciale]|nr:FAD/NAD(P)-binding domain-containing protein [Aureobasidium subglaciale]
MSSQKEVFIIGSGLSGLGMAIQLKRLLNFDNFTIFEKSDNVGGTWWHNRYPAAACDIAAHLYSYSFAPKTDWNEMYPGRDALHGLLINVSDILSVANKFDIMPHCQFNTMCLKMVWNESKSKWQCDFKNTLTGELFTREAHVVVSAVGTLDRPYVPELPGIERFKGEAFHSARWNDDIDLQGKKVIVLGNGASATQFVPRLVKQVGSEGQVTQLVRSAHYWIRRGNPKYSERFKYAMTYIPLAQRVYRFFLAWELETTFDSFYMTKRGKALRDKTRQLTDDFIQREAPAEYHEILKPNYEPGCKRRVNTLEYLKILHEPNMHLAKESTVEVTEVDLKTAKGNTYPADVIIYATGFMTQRWLFPMDVFGRGNQSLQEAWAAAGGAEAYKGTVVTGFPNFFILYGPNAATGQHSVVFHSECQINYSCRLLSPLLRNGADSINVTADAQSRDLAWVHKKLTNLVFNSGCQSWWMDSKTKKNTFIYPDPMWMYWLRTIFPTWSDFEIKKNGRPVGRGFDVRAWIGLLAGVAAGLVAYIMHSTTAEKNASIFSSVGKNLLASLDLKRYI